MELAKVYVNTSISKMENAKKKNMRAIDYFKENLKVNDDNFETEEEEYWNYLKIKKYLPGKYSGP